MKNCDLKGDILTNNSSEFLVLVSLIVNIPPRAHTTHMEGQTDWFMRNSLGGTIAPIAADSIRGQTIFS